MTTESMENAEIQNTLNTAFPLRAQHDDVLVLQGLQDRDLLAQVLQVPVTLPALRDELQRHDVRSELPPPLEDLPRT